MRYTVKPSSIRLRDDFEEYATSLPLLYERREEIYAKPEYFFAKLPYTIYGLKKSVCIGAILKAYEKGEPYHEVSEDGKTEEFLASYAGNPMTGTTTGLKTVITDGCVAQVQRFRYCGFLSLCKRLADCFHESGFPYRESELTIHDIIEKLKDNEANKRIQD